MRLLLGDCIDKLKELEDNSIDSIVTDPPYGLSFMGKDWDKKKATQETKSQVVKGLGAGMKMTTLADNIEFEKWVTEWSMECMRVLKPGGYMLAFGGSRMYHRLASGVENAGFEIRDQMMWIYGSGFPKSHNIGKAVDKQGGNSLGKEVAELVKEKRLEMGLSTIKLAELGKFYGNKNHGGTVSNWETGRGSITPEQFNKLIEILNLENNPIIETKREFISNESNWGKEGITSLPTSGEWTKTKGNSEWEGWGTALKPAHEPIVMARKPLSEKTVVDNVLEWGTGGINIDDSRIGTTKRTPGYKNPGNTMSGDSEWNKLYPGTQREVDTNEGRFPANVIFDEEAGKILDEQTGIIKTGDIKPYKSNTTSSIYGDSGFFKNTDVKTTNFKGDTGGASRFFYCPKTSKTDRNEGVDGNVHPTVKPTDLMLYLIRLVTPKGGTTLDPFMGSGSTGKAAARGGFDFVGIEMEDEYMEIAEARIQYEIDNPYNEEKGERVEINKNHEKFW